jgi:hypothetical protein
MRDPATHIDPEVEAAIEETRQFLEPHVNTAFWAADPDPRLEDIFMAIEQIWSAPLPEKTKVLAREALLWEMQKRRKKPTRRYRDRFLCMAAQRLVPRYRLSRNDETIDTESASSIIQKALARLGETGLAEKQVKDIVLKKPRGA